MRAVWRPRISLCCRKSRKEREERKRATRKLRGVSSTTRRETGTFLENMKTRVTATVRIPEKSWVKPSSSPSERTSVSAMTRLTMSPELWPSR